MLLLTIDFHGLWPLYRRRGNDSVDGFGDRSQGISDRGLRIADWRDGEAE